MIQIFVLIVATVVDIVVLIGLLSGKKYGSMIDSMKGIPLYKVCTVGFVVGDMIKPLRNKLVNSLSANTALVYGEKYSVYYANALIAQALSYILLIMSFALTIASFLSMTGMAFIIVIGVIGCAAIWNFCVLSVGDAVKERSTACLEEMPDMVIRFALLINSGMILREAWQLVAMSKNSTLYKLMLGACDDMRNGKSETSAIHSFGIKTNCQEIRKFTSSLIQGIEKGNEELSLFLVEQSQEMLEHKRQMMLQKGEKAAGKLILPIGITFVGVILIIAVAAMQSLAF